MVIEESRERRYVHQASRFRTFHSPFSISNSRLHPNFRAESTVAKNVARGARAADADRISAQHVFHSRSEREIKNLSRNFDACLARFVAKNAPPSTPPRGLKMAPGDSALTAVQAGVQSPSLVDEPGMSTGFARRIAKPFRSSGCKPRPTSLADFFSGPRGAAKRTPQLAVRSDETGKLNDRADEPASRAQFCLEQHVCLERHGRGS
jgi:hypothetical protein